MKFRILNKTGDEVLTLEKEEVKEKFDQLIEEGFHAQTKKGELVEDVEKVPDTVEELIFGKKAVWSGERGN